jgi:hypothetical protein
MQEVAPAFEEVKAQLEKHGRVVEFSVGTDQAHMKVRHEGQEELDYTVECNVRPGSATAFPVTRGYDEGGRYKAQGSFRSGSSCKDLKKADIIRDLLDNYKNYMTRSRT